MLGLGRRYDPRKAQVSAKTMPPCREYNTSLVTSGELTAQAAHDREKTVVRMDGRSMLATAKRPSAPQRAEQRSAPAAKEPQQNVMPCRADSSPRAVRQGEKLRWYGPWREVFGKNLRSFLKSLGGYHVYSVSTHDCPPPNAKPLPPPSSKKRSKLTCHVVDTPKILSPHGSDPPPDYCAVILEPRDIGVCDGKPVGGALNHDISLGRDTRVSLVSNRSGRNEGAAATQQRDTPLDTPDPTTKPAGSKDTRPPALVPQPSISEGEFNRFYHRLKPFEPRGEISPHVAIKPMPERKYFPLGEGPFTTPPGGTDLACVDGKPPSTFPDHEPIVTRVAGPRFMVQNTFSPSLLAGIASWELDALLKRAGAGSGLRHELRATETRFKILKFEHAFQNSDTSVLSDAYPLERPLPSCPPRVVDVTDEDGSLPARPFGTMLAGTDESGSTGARGAGESRMSSKNSQSGSLPPQRNLKRENDGRDRGNNKRKKQPPSDVPGTLGNSEPPGVPCPFRVKEMDRDRKSCITTFKNLSKLKEHLRRVHFRHLQCPIEGCSFIEGDKYQIQRHILTSHPGHGSLDPLLQNTNPEDRRKHEALENRKLTWEQISEICFSDASSDAAGGGGGGGGVTPNNEPIGSPGAQAPFLGFPNGPFNRYPPRDLDLERVHSNSRAINMGGYPPESRLHFAADGSPAGEELRSPANDPQEGVWSALLANNPRIQTHIDQLFENFRWVITQRLFESLRYRQGEATTPHPSSGKLSIFDQLNRYFMELENVSKDVFKPTSTFSSEIHSHDTWYQRDAPPEFSISDHFPQNFPRLWGHLAEAVPLSLNTGSQSGISMSAPDAPPRISFLGEHSVNAAPQQPEGNSTLQQLPPPPPLHPASAGAGHGIDGDLLNDVALLSGEHYTNTGDSWHNLGFE